LVYKEVYKIRLPRYNELETQIERGAGSFSDFASTGVQVDLEDVRSGDVLHMWGFYKGKRRATHCGGRHRAGLRSSCRRGRRILRFAL
jgi:cell wall-associated NlpC family hydrolase